MIAYGPPMKDFAAGEEHDNGNGTISIRKPNGKWLCVTPTGAVEERDTPEGRAVFWLPDVDLRPA